MDKIDTYRTRHKVVHYWQMGRSVIWCDGIEEARRISEGMLWCEIYSVNRRGEPLLIGEPSDG